MDVIAEWSDVMCPVSYVTLLVSATGLAASSQFMSSGKVITVRLSLNLFLLPSYLPTPSDMAYTLL